MTESLDKLTALRSEVEAARSRMKEAAQAVVKDGTRAIFEEYGDILAAFGWTQYTPYFNDGDPCEFGVHELALLAKEDEEDEGDYPYESSPAFSTWGGDGRSKVSSSYGQERAGDPRYDACLGACKQVHEVLAADELAKDVFGDHVRVIFTAEGVDVEEYYHD